MKRHTKEYNFKKYKVDVVVDGMKNIIILKPGADIGIDISWKNNKHRGLITNFIMIGNDYKKKKDKLKYELLIKIIGILYPFTK